MLVAFGAGPDAAAAVALVTHGGIILSEGVAGIGSAWALRLSGRDLFYIHPDDAGPGAEQAAAAITEDRLPRD